VSTTKAQLDTRDTREKIEKTLSHIRTDYIPDHVLREIREITRKASAWSTAKSVGAQIIPSGAATTQYEQLYALLRTSGLFVVPVGELEGFDKSIGGHGPSWVGKVMQKDLGKDVNLASARKFVQSVVEVS
jgi:hypothetical protein